MCECRYYGKCAGNCDGRGLVLGFGNETYDCDCFQPMPDIEELLELAKKLDSMGVNTWSNGWSKGSINVGWIARRIRKACEGWG